MLPRGRGVEVGSEWREALPSQHSSVFSQEVLLNLNFGIKVFIGILLTRYDRLHIGHMFANSVSSSSPLPEGGAASKLQPSKHTLVFLVTSRILSHLSNINSGMIHGLMKNRHYSHSGKGFRSFVSKPELGQRPGVVFILHPHLQTNMEGSIDGSTGQSKA